MPKEPRTPDACPKHRLNSWKDIANHFGKDLSPRTAQRWEAEGLPVYREGTKVFAFAEDLDQWQKNRTVGPASQAVHNIPDSRPRPFIKVGALLAVAAVIGTTFLTIRQRYPGAIPDRRPLRLFAHASSEGHSPRRLETRQEYMLLLMAPDGKELYAISRPQDRSLTVIGVEDLEIKRTIRLPLPPRTAILSRNGKRIYISSLENGVMVVDTTPGNHSVERVIPTDGPAFDIAVTQDEKKIFLAMGYRGLRRVSLLTGEGRVLLPLACPMFLNINPSG